MNFFCLLFFIPMTLCEDCITYLSGIQFSSIHVTPASRFVIHAETLRVVNFGAGTTGTTTLYNIMCNSYAVPSLHFRRICHSTASNPLMHWYTHVVRCASSVTPIAVCQSGHLLSRLQLALQRVATTMTFVTDSPIDGIFTELLAASPQAAILNSCRDPATWAQRRMYGHSNAIICAHRHWNYILHPFDYIGCLQHSTSAAEAFVTLQDFVNASSLSELAVAYKTMDEYNTRVAQGRVLRLQLEDLTTSYETRNKYLESLRCYLDVFGIHNISEITSFHNR